MRRPTRPENESPSTRWRDGYASNLPTWVVDGITPRTARYLRLRHDTRTFLGRYPTYVRLLRWRHGPNTGIIGPEKELVIEGYPRCGKTFSVTALTLAQGRQVRTADHLCAPAQISLAIRWGIPALVLIREPEPAVTDYIIKFPHITVQQGLRNYLDFYKHVAPYRHHFVLARFEDVTTDFGEVTRWVNQKFGTSFAEFDHTDENVARCFELIDEQYHRRARKRGEKPVEEILSPPLQEELMARLELSQRLRAPELADLRQRAEQLYERLASDPGP